MPQTDQYDRTDIDNEMFLSTIPLNLIEEAIKTQFNDPLEYRKTDYVQNFLNKYEFSVENMYEEDQETLDELHDDFIDFMKTILYEYLGVGFSDIEDIPEEDQHKLIHYTYQYFICDIKKNFTNLLLNYIDKYPDEIMSISEKKKDVIYLNFKAEISDEKDLMVLSNLSTVIDSVLSEEFEDINDFIELTAPNELCVELEYVKTKFEDFSLTGNFIPNYISMVDGYFKTELESKLRNKILKKYPKRKKAVVVEDSDENESSINEE